LKDVTKGIIMTENFVCCYAMSVGTFRGSGAVVAVCNQAKPASLQFLSNRYILLSKHSKLYSLRGLFNTNHKDMNKKFKHCFSITVDMSIKMLACTNGMKVWKVFSSLEKLSGVSGRNR
jgi:hypothetical protein